MSKTTVSTDSSASRSEATSKPPTKMRFFKNKYADYVGESPFDDEKKKLDDDFSLLLTEEVNAMLNRLYLGLEEHLTFDDYTVYTGTTGIGLLHLHMHNTLEDQRGDLLKKALMYIEPPLDGLKKKRVTFLCGDAGPLVIGAVIYHLLGKEKESGKCIKRLLRRHEDVMNDKSLPNELLFGRVGWLYALLYVRAHLGTHFIEDKMINEVYDEIIKQGQNKADKEKWKCPLMYEWHESNYFGAAHGIMGIMHVLMMVNDEDHKDQLENLIRPTLDYLITLRYPSGNYPSSYGSENDRLVHWCHGAPGWIHTFVKAYQIFQDSRYLDEAINCGEVIWERGLLKKGYGLCHGASGNAYGFLKLFQATQDVKYVYRAWKFAEWCFNYGSHGCRTPDRPMSLFEGMAGTVYFLCDLLDPLNAKFPGFDI